MARRKLIWHLGLADAARPVVSHGLEQRRESLEALGLAVVADRREAELATHELLRSHEQAGLSAADVGGQWAAVADRVWAHRGASLVSTPQLCAGDRDQLRLALDPLIGVEVHLVVTAEPLPEQLYGAWVAELLQGSRTAWRKYSGRVQRPVLDPGRGNQQAARFWAGHELASLVARWGWTLHADRLHVVLGEPQEQWSQLLDIAGVRGEEAEATRPSLPAYVDPAAAAVLREVNRCADSPLTPTERRLVLASSGAESGARPVLPAHDVGELADVVSHWATTLAARGHDVRGDLASLLDGDGPGSLPASRERLASATQALADTLGENAELRRRVGELEADVERLDHKRRTWKRRAKTRAPDSPAELVAEQVG